MRVGFNNRSSIKSKHPFLLKIDMIINGEIKKQSGSGMKKKLYLLVSVESYNRSEEVHYVRKIIYSIKSI